MSSGTVVDQCAGAVEDNLLDEIVLAAQILSARGLVEGFGHVSARAESGGRKVVVITPRRPLATASRQNLAVVDLLSGETLGGNPPLEVSMHRAVYRIRPDVSGICRTHSPMASAFGVVGRPIRILHGLGAWLSNVVPVHDATTLVTDDGHATEVAKQIPPHGALLLRGNGAVVAAPTVVEALFKSVLVEDAAILEYHAERLGTPNYWTVGQCEERNAEDFGHEPIRSWEYYRSQVYGTQ